MQQFETVPWWMLCGLLPLFSNVSTAATSVQTPRFYARSEYSFYCGSNYSQTIIAADVNGDGNLDVVCGSGDVLLGNGKGGFRLIPYAYAGALVVEAADINHDGKVDLIASGVQNPATELWGISVVLGNGDGTFQPPTYYPTTDSVDLNSLVYTDFNSDGIGDVITRGNQGIWLFLGRADGTFQPGTILPVGPQQYTGESVVEADFDGDGKEDLAAMLPNGFQILLGNGDATFRPQPVVVCSIFNSPINIETADLNGDGRPDILLTSVGYSYVGISLNQGNASFPPPTRVSLPGFTVVAIADANGDGIPDLISSGVYVALGRGDGTFRPPSYFPVASAPPEGGSSVLAADLRHLGVPDLVVSEVFSGTTILTNLGNGTYREAITSPVPGGEAGCSVSADFDRDGKPDLAVTAATGLQILLGTGKVAKPFRAGTLYPILAAVCPVVGDLNGDGIPDLFMPVFSQTVTVALLGNGDGTFTQAPSGTVPAVGNATLGDFNGDGKLDYALASNYMAFGNGDGTLQTPQKFVPNILPVSQADGLLGIGSADLNGDGLEDIILTDAFQSYLYVLLNTGGGKFTETTQSTNFARGCLFPASLAIGDLNGDGAPDLVLGCSDNDFTLYLNDGKGTMTYGRTLVDNLLSSVMVPQIGDLNGDGIPDLAVLANYHVAVYPGLGGARFGTPQYWGVGPIAANVILANVHGQPASSGKLDILVPDLSGVIYTLINTTPAR